MRDGRWRYTIRAFYPPNAQPPHVPNALAVETVHATEASRDVEMAAFRERMKRREIGHVDVISHVPPYFTWTHYPEA